MKSIEYVYREILYQAIEKKNRKLTQMEHFLPRLKTIVKTFKDIQYLNLNPRQFKLKKEKILSKI